MMIGNEPHTLFNNYAAAEKVTVDIEANEFRIDVDPKGSGRCVIRILDEETGEVIGTL